MKDLSIKRTTSHSNAEMNISKRHTLEEFSVEYIAAVRFYEKEIWTKGLTYKDKKGKVHVFKPLEDKWGQLSKYMDTTIGPAGSSLSGRALKAAGTQAVGIIKGAVKKYQKKKFMLAKLQRIDISKMSDETKAKHLKNIKRLQRIVDTRKPKLPISKSVNPELDSNCAKFMPGSTKFDGFLVLASIGKKYGKIAIPISFHKRSRYWQEKGTMMKSFLICADATNIRWKYTPKENKSTTEVGGDIGQKTVLSFSMPVNNILTSDQIKDPHGYTLQDINKKTARKKKGSKGYYRAVAHAQNLINFLIKRMISPEIGTLKLESNKNIKKGRRVNRALAAWSWHDIYESIKSNCKEQNVSVELQQSPYKSQRCFLCGFTHQSNRRGKEFRCKQCKYLADSDVNSAQNNAMNLVKLSRFAVADRNKQFGFVWTESEVTYLDMSNSPCRKKRNDIKISK